MAINVEEKAWRVSLEYSPEWGWWVHATSSGKAKSKARKFEIFDGDPGIFIFMRTQRAPELDGMPLTMTNLKDVGCYLVEYDEDEEPSTEADWPIYCDCPICAPEEMKRRERCRGIGINVGGGR